MHFFSYLFCSNHSYFRTIYRCNIFIDKTWIVTFFVKKTTGTILNIFTEFFVNYKFHFFGHWNGRGGFRVSEVPIRSDSRVHAADVASPHIRRRVLTGAGLDEAAPNAEHHHAANGVENGQEKGAELEKLNGQFLVFCVVSVLSWTVTYEGG